MGERKRKKKGRPSLLDLQKRSLRLQKQQQDDDQNPNPNPSSNPYLRFPPSRRRNPAAPPPDAADDDDDDEDDEGGSASGRPRREKKLKLVLRLPPGGRSPSASDSDGARDKTRSPASKATDALQGEPSDSGPTTPLPDKKLLVFILDRLQKKDTYGVFSEPVDLDELPDYLDVVDHPMDFATVRNKLSNGEYQNLEQFEKDVFLISTNAMTYNAPDTIYYRQARAIQELAKKNFENLRQESDDNEPEPKTVRRGRPPSKNANKRTGKSAERAASDFSDATLANVGDNSHGSNLANDLSRKGSSTDKPGTADVTTRSLYSLRNSEIHSGINERKSERNEEYTGSVLKGMQTKYGKKPAVVDENRRNTYKQPITSTSMHEPPILSTFDGELKQLARVGLYMEHTYARSLARFAANLGPIGWEIAAKRIQRALPPGTRFGRGWVGDSEAPQQPQPPLLATSPSHSSQRNLLTSAGLRDDKLPERHEPPDSNQAGGEGHPSRSFHPATAARNRSSDAVDGSDPSRGLNNEGRLNLPSGGAGIHPRTPFKLQESSNSFVQPGMNGLSAAAFGLDPPGQAGKMARPMRHPGSYSLEPPMTHGGVLNMVSRGSNNFLHQATRSLLDGERAKVVGSPSMVTPSKPLPDSSHDFQGQWQGLSQNLRPVSVPPDLNVSFQLPGSPASGVVVDSQQPDLALQL